VNHLPGLEDAPLRVDEGDALALELESSGEIAGVEDALMVASRFT
jgi:hypothetical protein